MRKISGLEEKQDGRPVVKSTFRDRLFFVIWYAGRELGTENMKQFGEAIGKKGTQLSKWAKEEPRPSWESIKAIADVVHLSAAWLDDPDRLEAQEPPEFAGWLAARRQREQREQREKRRRA